jgi:hypothetical protein
MPWSGERHELSACSMIATSFSQARNVSVPPNFSKSCAASTIAPVVSSWI